MPRPPFTVEGVMIDPEAAALLEAKRAGTFMYHSHSNEMQQISSGLYGAIVVNEPGVKRDTLHDKVLPPDNQIAIARRIPGATIHDIEAGHAACVLQAERFVPALVEAATTVNARRRDIARRDQHALFPIRDSFRDASHARGDDRVRQDGDRDRPLGTGGARDGRGRLARHPAAHHRDQHGRRGGRVEPGAEEEDPEQARSSGREHGIRLLEVTPTDESLESVFAYLVSA